MRWRPSNWWAREHVEEGREGNVERNAYGSDDVKEERKNCEFRAQ
jgi:hypothetical protein